MQTSTLDVLWGGRRIGLLRCEAGTYWRFLPESARGVVPVWSGLLRASAPGGNVHAWCRHLLPDAEACAGLARRLGLSPGNDFALLAQRGSDCPGAVAFAVPGAAPAPAERWRPMSPAERAACRPGRLGILLPDSLARLPGLPPGPPGRVPCLWRDADSTPLVGGGLAGHLASAGRPGFEEALENEALCMALAAALSLPVPAVRLLDGDAPLLVTARADRLCPQEGDVRRVHAESLAQLAGVAPERSFEREGGLGLRDCVALLRERSAAPAPDLRTLLRWLVFCFVAGIGHAHARTLLLVEGAGGPRLAIDGGLFATHVYQDVDERLAFRIGGEERPDWLRLARWNDLADELAVGRRYLLALVGALANALPGLATRVVAGNPALARSASVVPRMLRLIANRTRQTQIALTAEGG